jgi:mRNA turnover protein 4
MSSHHDHARLNLRKKDKAYEIRESLTQYERIYMIRVTSVKSEYLSEIRHEFRSSTLCMAKHRIIANVFGTTAEGSVQPNLRELNCYLPPHTGVFMTNEPHEKVIQFLESMTRPDFSQTGDIAPKTFTVPVGLLSQFTFNMGSYLQGLGLPVQLENGSVTNIRDHDICTAGEPLTRNAAQLLRRFGVKMGKFEAKMVSI